MKEERRKSLDELSSEEIVRACEDNYADFWRFVGMSSNAEHSEDGGITYCITGLSQDVFNVVLKCNLDLETIDLRIDRVIGYFRSRHIPLLWHTGISSRPRDIGRYLEARGFPHDYDLAAMAVDLDSFDDYVDLSEDASVKTVVDSRDSRHWAEALTSAWESPKEAVPWMLQNACLNPSRESQARTLLPRRLYLGLLAGKPVSTSMLLWSNGVAGLEMIGTVPSARGKGIGTAVVMKALSDARSMGFRFVVVLSTIEGVGLYKRCGFKEFGKLPEHSMNFMDAHQ